MFNIINIDINKSTSLNNIINLSNHIYIININWGNIMNIPYFPGISCSNLIFIIKNFFKVLSVFVFDKFIQVVVLNKLALSQLYNIIWNNFLFY